MTTGSKNYAAKDALELLKDLGLEQQVSWLEHEAPAEISVLTRCRSFGFWKSSENCPKRRLGALFLNPKSHHGTCKEQKLTIASSLIMTDCLFRAPSHQSLIACL